MTYIRLDRVSTVDDLTTAMRRAHLFSDAIPIDPRKQLPVRFCDGQLHESRRIYTPDQNAALGY